MQRARQQGVAGVVSQPVAIARWVAIGLLVVSCAGRKSQIQGAPTAAQTGSVLPASPHDQIQVLDDENTAAMSRLELGEPSPEVAPQSSPEPMGAITAARDPQCRPAKNEVCTTSCTLSDSVCSNADKICTLAKSMAGDTWAANKCVKANLSCDASHKKCCACE